MSMMSCDICDELVDTDECECIYTERENWIVCGYDCFEQNYLDEREGYLRGLIKQIFSKPKEKRKKFVAQIHEYKNYMRDNNDIEKILDDCL